MTLQPFLSPPLPLPLFCFSFLATVLSLLSVQMDNIYFLFCFTVYHTSSLGWFQKWNIGKASHVYSTGTSQLRELGLWLWLLLLFLFFKFLMGSFVFLRCREFDCKAGDPGSIPWVRKIPLEKANDNPPQYTYLENPMDRPWATIQAVRKSQTRLATNSFEEFPQLKWLST